MSNVYQTPISATLARRLAEAADGFRNVDQVFFIAQYEDPYTILDFLTLTSAEHYFNEHNFQTTEYGIFGPYRTLDEFNKSGQKQVEDITSIDLKIHFKDGGHENATLQGSIDSIFFNLSSLDKFIFPYYCHVYGVDHAKKMRDTIIKEHKEKGAFFSMLSNPAKHINVTYLMYNNAR